MKDVIARSWKQSWKCWALQAAIPMRQISSGSSQPRECLDVEEAEAAQPALAHLLPAQQSARRNGCGQGSCCPDDSPRLSCSRATDDRLQDSDGRDVLYYTGSTRNFADWLAHCCETRALRVLAQGPRRFENPPTLPRIGYVKGDRAAIAREVQWFSGKPQEYLSFGLQAADLNIHGRMPAARSGT